MNPEVIAILEQSARSAVEALLAAHNTAGSADAQVKNALAAFDDAFEYLTAAERE